MTLKTTLAAITVLLSATTVSLAQSMPNYGPNAPSTGDSFGKPPSGTRPPGVTRNGYHAYAYQRRQYHRHWHTRPYE
jgi:hypothetical protein